MSIWTLIIVIAVAWLSYPFAGGARLRLDVLEGRRPKDAGFSFLPELLVFPAAFLCTAIVIDHFAMPYGRRIVGGICILGSVAEFVGENGVPDDSAGKEWRLSNVANLGVRL
ncbi:MAG: hypothetical protein IT581_13660 [Verrucomicrobiales bacterium]|nr:hypothetical protein [Verrucomicrobiales bacterium]